MINKLTIEKIWTINPKQRYFVIANPRIDTKSKKLNGIYVKVVEYKVRDWDTKYVYFERNDKDHNKRFPAVIEFDKRSPNAENEVLAAKVSKAKKQPTSLQSYAIFSSASVARYCKLNRLHSLATELHGKYTALSQPTDKLKMDDATVRKSKSLHKSDIKRYFDEIQATEYYDELERLEIEFPDLAAR